VSTVSLTTTRVLCLLDLVEDRDDRESEAAGVTIWEAAGGAAGGAVGEALAASDVEAGCSSPGAIFAQRAVSQHVKFAANLFAMQSGARMQMFVEGKELLLVNQPLIVGVFVALSTGIFSPVLFVCSVRIFVLVRVFEGPFGGRKSISRNSRRNVAGLF